MNHTNRYKDVIRNIENGPEGAHIAAIFDFDGTIISGYSATVFLKEQLRGGGMGLGQLAEMVSVTGQMAVGKIGFSGMMASAAKMLNGVSEASYEEMGEELFETQIRSKIYPAARAIIEAHRAKGHTLAIISSATPYQVEPAARELEIEHVLCTRYEVENGEFNGNIVRPVCFGEGKVIAAEQLSRDQEVDLSESYFYSDSDDDLELLERVGRPQAMNPNKSLTKIAERRGWPIRRLSLPKKPTVVDRARSIAATGSLVTSFLNGLPIFALTRSRKEAVNFSISRFGDIAAALINMKLNVKDEKNLWIARPCVFLFNHQSGADMMIMAKLIRRDIVGVGKKEIAKIPVLGKVMQYGGAVLIDRENAASAIAALTPLVEKMHEEQVSVCIAPEGTRSNSKKLGKFKKGAFHIAMQAQVPIVPIVIHNAHEILPGDGKVFRPGTVDIEVLPPVDTSEWSPATIDKHVAEVEQMYLDALGQERIEDKPQRAASKKSKPVKRRKAKRTTTKVSARKKSASSNTGQKNDAVAKKKSSSIKKTSAKAESNNVADLDAARQVRKK